MFIEGLAIQNSQRSEERILFALELITIAFAPPNADQENLISSNL